MTGQSVRPPSKYSPAGHGIRKRQHVLGPLGSQEILVSWGGGGVPVQAAVLLTGGPGPDWLWRRGPGRGVGRGGALEVGPGRGVGWGSGGGA